MQLEDKTYFCLISNFNVAEFEGCLHHRPAVVVLIVSDQRSSQESAFRFEEQLKQALPEVIVIRPDKKADEKFDGADYKGTQIWALKHIKPMIEQAQGQKICNITGGTKAMTLVFSDPCLGWDSIEYRAEGSIKTQVLRYKNSQYLPDNENVCTTFAKPLALARLHNNDAEELEPNPIVKQEHSLVIAQRMWDALQSDHSALDALLGSSSGDQNTGLTRYWSSDRKNHQYKKQSLELNILDLVDEKYKQEALDWLGAWSSLDIESISVHGDRIIIPGNKNKNNLQSWISGYWLEQLVTSWLQEFVPEENIATSLVVSSKHENKNKIDARETDIFVHYKGSTGLIEVKADFPPNARARNFLEQVSSMVDRLGRTQKILFIGPQISKALSKDEQQKKVFEQQCRGFNVRLATNKKELLESLRIKHG